MTTGAGAQEGLRGPGCSMFAYCGHRIWLSHGLAPGPSRVFLPVQSQLTLSPQLAMCVRPLRRRVEVGPD